MERGGKKMAPGEFGYSVPSSCPSPSGEGTRERGSLLWVAYRLSRRWHLGSDPGRTCRAASLPRRRENKREGQPDDSLPVVDRYTARQSPACLHTNAQVVSIPSSCPSPSGEGTRGPGVCARPRNQAPGPKARPGPLSVRLFPSPFRPLLGRSKRGPPGGDTSRTAPENQEFVYVFAKSLRGRGNRRGLPLTVRWRRRTDWGGRPARCRCRSG